MRQASLAGDDLRGDLQQLGLPELLQLLSARGCSGALTLQTPLGAGEIRLYEGAIVDALYRRLEGQKALFRLLSEPEAIYAFAAGEAELLRRIDAPTPALLREGRRQLDELRQLRDALALGEDGLVALTHPASADTDIARSVLEMLTTPHTVAELLDEVPALDLDVLTALCALLEAGKVRRIAGGSGKVELCDGEQLAVLAVLAKRVARSGFGGVPRVVFAASPQRLLGLRAALARLSQAVPSAETAAPGPIPQVLCSLRLSESVDLEVLALPLVEVYSPLWGLVLPSCTALAVAAHESSPLLESACQRAGVPVLDTAAALGEGDETDAREVALLIQRLLASGA